MITSGRPHLRRGLLASSSKGRAGPPRRPIASGPGPSLSWLPWKVAAGVGAAALFDGFVVGPWWEKRKADGEPGASTHLARVHAVPRPGWQAKVREAGLPFGELEGSFWARPHWQWLKRALPALPAVGRSDPYWNEAAYYRVSEAGMWEVEKAAFELHSMCLEAVDDVVADDALLERFGTPQDLWPLVTTSGSNFLFNPSTAAAARRRGRCHC